MDTERSLRRAIRSAIAGALALAAPQMFHAANAADAAEPEEVIVTGSRIARSSDFENPSPVITVDREGIEKSGYNNIQQLMEKLPANGSGAFSTRGNNQDSTANGAASISLRGLGPDATLVLVNGRRVAINSFAENVSNSFVDINSIPVAAIERIEVLKDGSSAVYGSDAVAGVVNIILRKDFQGFETALSYGAEGSDYNEKTVSAIWGLGDDDSNVTMVLDYFKNTTLSNLERGASFATADQTARGGQDFRSSRGFPGAFTVTTASGTTTVPDPACPAARRTSSACIFDYGPFNLLIPEAERTGFMLLAHQKIGAIGEVFTELAWQRNTSIAQGAPTPIDNQAGLTVPVTHPNNPFVGATAISISRYRTVDAGPRQFNIENENMRGVVGLRGTIGGWDWEVAAQRARGEAQQTGDKTQGWVRTDFLQQEINAGRYNPFGGVQNSAAEINAITTNLVRRGNSRLTMYDASITGELFELPAGAVRMAAGGEYRQEAVADIPDDQFQRGLIFGTEAVSANGSRDAWAAYVEFAVPIVTGLEASLALRYDDYSDFGDTTNPKIALRYSPIDSLALRASWGTGFRAPSLAQIGLGPSQSSQFFIDTFGCQAGVPGACTALDYNKVFSGNPNLKAEESKSWNAGIAWRPVAGAELTLDYWKITVDGKITEAPFGPIYNANCNSQNSTVCVRGTPLPGQTLGNLQTIATTFTNIGEQRTDGIDLGATYGFVVGPGTLTLGLSYQYLLNFDRVEANDTGGFVTRALAGEYEYPENRATFTADWGNAIWGAYAQVNYIGEFQDTPDANFDGVQDYDTVKTPEVGAFTTLNLQFRYTGIDHVKLMVGLDNALDKDPPFVVGDGNNDIYGYSQNVHNPRGRFWSAKAVFTF
jgi:outer membrane receptor for ferrienterochelin and colicin